MYVMRHGERMDMADLTWISQNMRPWDPPLSPFGMSQAKQRGMLFASSLPVDVVVTSPFTRCIETASTFMQAYGLPPSRLIVDACVAEWMSLRNLNLAHVSAQDRAKLQGNVEDWFWGVAPHAGLKAVLAAAWGIKAASEVSPCLIELQPSFFYVNESIWVFAECSNSTKAAVVLPNSTCLHCSHMLQNRLE